MTEAEKLAAQDAIMQRLAAQDAAIARLQAEAEAPPPDAGPNRFQAAARGLHQGLTFGWGDELTAALGHVLPDGKGYAEHLSEQQARNAAAREDHPVAMTVPEIAGGVATGVAGGALAGLGRAGVGLGARVAQGAGMGAAEGALYGAGSAEPGLEERAEGLAWGAGVGAGLGGAMAPVGNALRGLGRTITEPIRGAIGGGNQGRAARALGRTMDAAGLTVDDVAERLRAAADDGQPMYVTADALGYEGQRALSGQARRPGAGREAIVNALEGRQGGQRDRLAAFLGDALGSTRTADETVADMTAQRGRTANRLYDAARQDAGPVDVRGAVAAVDRVTGGMRGSGFAGDGIDAAMNRFRARLANEDGSVTLSDFNRVMGVKRDVEDAIGAARRAGRNNEARLLMELKGELDAALESASAGYRAANDTFAADSRAIDAVEAGRRAARPSRRPEDTVREWNALAGTPADDLPAFPGDMAMDPRAAYRTGYGEPYQARMAAQAPGADGSRMFTTPKAEEEMAALARDPDLWARRVGREAEMAATRRQALGGSMTAQNLADNAAGEGADLGAVMEVARDAGNLNFGSLAVRLAQGLRGENEATRRLIVEALLSRDPRNALAPVPLTQAQDARRMMMLEALLRQSATRPAVSAVTGPG